MAAVRILVVDDSAFMRLTIGKRLADEPGLEVIGTARDGYEALAQIRALKPDVVTMDVEMPGISGLETLQQVMIQQPTPVIMLSTLTHEGTATTVKALTLGAVDFIGKPDRLSGMQETIKELATKIRHASTVNVSRRASPSPRQATSLPAKAQLRPLTAGDPIIVVGSSTGGPGALRGLMADLPGNLGAAMLIVQHMPPGFTRSLAERLDEVSSWRVKEAEAGDKLQVGQALLAAGGSHLVCRSRGEVSLTKEPPVNNVRPSVDVTMHSLVEIYGGRVSGVILTGMGKDGAEGAIRIKAAGGRVIAEAESSCVVYGMPRSVVEAGAADIIAPLPDIARALQSMLMRSLP